MTQIQPEMMMVFLRPIQSASFVTMSAPTREPAGMAATMAPCALEVGLPKVFLYASFWRANEAVRTSRHRRYVHSEHRTWTKCPNRRGRRRYMRTTRQCTARGVSGRKVGATRRRHTGFPAMKGEYCNEKEVSTRRRHGGRKVAYAFTHVREGRLREEL